MSAFQEAGGLLKTAAHDSIQMGKEELLKSVDSFTRKTIQAESPSVTHAGDQFSIKAVSKQSLKPAASHYKLEDIFSPDDLKWISELEAHQKSIPVSQVSDTKIAELVKKNYGIGAATKEKKLHLVVGPPGSGKSSVLVNPLAEKHGAMVIDSDAIKPQIEGYANGLGTNAVHPASAKVANQMLIHALNSGDNIVHPIVGRNEADLIAMIQAAKERGYSVGLHLADVPPEVSAKRVVARAKAGSTAGGVVQMVHPDYALNVVGTKPQEVFNALKDRKDLVTEYSHYNTNVPYGAQPILVSQS